MLNVRRKQDADPMKILVMQMGQGKTVESGKRQYARALRHKDPTKCAVGGFGYYLLFRFHMSNEMTERNRPDFTENKEWFDIKILTDGTRVEGSTKEMARRCYTDRVKECFRRLDIYSNAYGHWGRFSGPPKLELEEVPSEFIRILGKFSLLLFSFFVFHHSSQVIGILKRRIAATHPSWLLLR
jgi:hypothetical protein